MTPAPVHLEFLRNYNQLLPAPGERVGIIITCGFGGGDKFSRRSGRGRLHAAKTRTRPTTSSGLARALPDLPPSTQGPGA